MMETEAHARILLQQLLLKRPIGRPKRKTGWDDDFKIVLQTEDRKFVLTSNSGALFLRIGKPSSS
jgi:hypothetical protein